MVSNLKLLTAVVDDSGNVNIPLLQRYLEELPERALQISLKVIFALLVLFIGLKLIKWFRKIVKRTLIKMNADTGLIQFLDSFIKFILIAVLVLAIASKFGFEATSIVTILGSAGIAIGLALQGSLSNFAGGVLILLLKPFKVGDYIKEDTKGNEGTVTEISLIYTKLTTYDGKIIILPNGTLANTSMTNVTGTESRKLDIKVSVSYDTDIKNLRSILLKMLSKEKKVIQNEEKNIYVHELAESGIVIGIRCFVKNDDYWDMKWSLTETVKDTLEQNHISIPYPQMDVHIKQSDNL